MIDTICEVIVSLMAIVLSLLVGNYLDAKFQRYYWMPPVGFFIPLLVWVGILAVWFECLL
jgi:hypothetical protein